MSDFSSEALECVDASETVTDDIPSRGQSFGDT